MKRKIGIIVVVLILVGVGKYVYDVNINHNFKAITEGKVYKSGVIPPDQLEGYIKEHNIKSIVDLRFPGTDDLVNNPEIPEELTAEKEAIEKIKGINYFNIGSEQVPSEEALDKFYNVIDDSANYPLLIHCYHGDGRAQMFSAIYRIEKEGMSNEEARKKARVLLKWSSFDDGKPKGEFLKSYMTRREIEDEERDLLQEER